MNPHTHPSHADRPPPPSWTYRILMGVMAPVEWALHFNCRTFMRLASAQCDRPLGPAEKLVFHAHRLICAICRRQEKRMRQMRDLVHSSVHLEDHDHAVKLNDEARAQLEERIARELSGAGGDGPTTP